MSVKMCLIFWKNTLFFPPFGFESTPGHSDVTHRPHLCTQVGSFLAAVFFSFSFGF